MYKVKYVTKNGDNRTIPFHVKADAVEFRDALREAGMRGDIIQDEYNDRSIMTVQEVAKDIACSKEYVYKLIKLGLLPSIKLGSTKVLRKSLHRFLEEYEGQDVDEIIKNISEREVAV